MRTRRISFDWITVYCNSTTAVFIPVSPWMEAAEISNLQVPFELRARVGDTQVRAAYQTANDPRSPDSATGFGGTLTAEGFEDPTSLTDVAATFAGKRYFRLGFLVSSTVGSATSLGRVSGQALLVSR